MKHMPMVASNAPSFELDSSGGWRFARWSTPRVMAGVTSRHITPTQMLSDFNGVFHLVEAEQVHGGSIAVIGRAAGRSMIAGCDALVTDVPGQALLIRTADCIPLLLADAGRGVIAIIHAGWRGLACQLPLRVLALLGRLFHSDAGRIDVAIGPAIRACCYEVGPEFVGRFGRFVTLTDGRRRCDLVGIAIEQLQRGGVRPGHIFDSGQCTACAPERWFSVRREGNATGRLTSVIVLRP